MLPDKQEPSLQFFNKISDAIIITDLEFNIKAWNRAAELTYGWKAEEIIGKNIMNTIRIEYINQEQDKVLMEFEKEGKWKGDVVQYTKNGEEIHIFSSVSLIKDKNGNPTEIVAINQNKTKTRKIEDKLKLSKEKYRLIVENAHEGIWMIDEHGYTSFVNDRMAEILGYRREEMLDAHLFNYMDEEYKKIAKKNLKRGKQGIREQHEFVFVGKDRKRISVLLSASPLFTEKEKYIGAVALISDITDKKKAEEKLKKSEKRYRDAYEQANLYRDLFTHDMNNILQVIISSSELISYDKNDIDDKIESYLEIIKNQAQQGAALINSIHRLSELEEKDIELEPIELIGILDRQLEYIKKMYKEKEILIERNNEINQYVILANRFLGEVFRNILTNSIKYNNNSKIEIIIKVSMEIVDDREYIKLQFIDNGLGIKDEKKEIIFHKGKKDLKGSKGMGIGLSLVKVIIEKYQGKIWVEDRIEGNYKMGSKFIVLLPKLKK
ncbi:MAG: PAS domain S-box protein [Candidatus Lokiarchaeota archaeon]|nr:PAS domain S-box protein [Candidatus Lokiarchaeota archaeon]MBD3200794.1 PAS domain S-box protein [Candidatus Lokiarchaeota archaeon]